MSRLDDELRVAFRRQEPSADFAERVLARLNTESKAAPQPKPSFWQTLLDFFRPQPLRWAVAAAVVLLLAVIGYLQVQRLQKPAIQQQVQTVPQQPAPPDQPQQAIAPTPKADDQKTPPEKKDPGVWKKPVSRPMTVIANLPKRKRALPVQNDNEATQVAVTTVKSQGEIAKEQLLRALAITSTLISEAKDAAITGKE